MYERQRPPPQFGPLYSAESIVYSSTGTGLPLKRELITRDSPFGPTQCDIMIKWPCHSEPIIRDLIEYKCIYT